MVEEDTVHATSGHSVLRLSVVHIIRAMLWVD